MSKNELLSILVELHYLTGFRISIHNTAFQEIEAYPKNPSKFCSLIQTEEDGLNRCRKNDIDAFTKASKGSEVYLYQCCFGLYEAVAPLYVLGNLTGYMMMGQIIDSETGSIELLMRNGREFIKDDLLLEAAARSVRVEDKRKIISSMKILDICAQYITFSNRINVNYQDLPKRVKMYIDTAFKEDISLGFLSRHFFCSRSTLTKEFKKKYNLGVIEYLSKVRIENAKKLLKETELSVKNISARCGYDEQNYFTKVFLKQTGMTPTAYRKAGFKLISEDKGAHNKTIPHTQNYVEDNK